MLSRSLPMSLFVLLLASAPKLAAQKNSGNPSPAPSGSSLTGLSFDQAHWASDLKLPTVPEGKRAVACFQLNYAANGTQPFVLIPMHVVSIEKSPPPSLGPFLASCKGTASSDQDSVMQPWCKKHPDGAWTACSLMDDNHPIMMGQQLVVGIDTSQVFVERLKLLNLNVTTVASTPINPTPVRPSFSNSGGSVSLSSTEFYITWPVSLPGDVIPTLSVNAIYTPPLAGERWSQRTYYSVGSVVTPSNSNGHYYVAIAGGISLDHEPGFVASIPSVVSDGAVTWVDSGPMSSSASAGKAPGVWFPVHSYNQGDSIVDPYNGHTYTALSVNASVSGPAVGEPFSLPTPTAPNVQQAVPPTIVVDGTVTWQSNGTAACPQQWIPGHAYKLADAVGTYNGTCYAVKIAGVSGNRPAMPNFPTGAGNPVRDGATASQKLAWVDYGVAPPASVTGAPATDQTVNLLTLQLSQTHAKSYYNLSSGVVYSTVHNRTFGIPSGSTSTASQVQTSSSPTIDPVLLFTGYPWPADTERHCSFPKCLWQTKPGISFGLSLASPSSSFYAGGSFEIFRNIQIVVGNNWAKSAQLPSPPVTLASNATSAVTVQKFRAGAAYGLTFNISGFIQSLFGGGGSSKSTSSSSQ